MTAPPIPVPAAVRARVEHRRTRPFSYVFGHGTTMWLVDVADPQAAFPRWLRPLASLRSEDHFAADDHRPLADKVRGYLVANDLPWSADRVLMLANARSLGYVFDPLTTFFCLDAEGRLEGVLAEVHNTYGERHCYPLAAGRGPAAPADPVRSGSAAVAKQFYVSPFYAVEGRYDVRTRLTPDAVAVGIRLTQDGRTVFTGSVRGPLRPVSRRTAVREVLRNPLPSQRVAALIRWHGIRLWLRRLPVLPRSPHQAPKGMA